MESWIIRLLKSGYECLFQASDELLKDPIEFFMYLQYTVYSHNLLDPTVHTGNTIEIVKHWNTDLL